MTFDDAENVLGRRRSGTENGCGADGERKIQRVAQAIGEEEFGRTEKAVGLADLEHVRGVLLGGNAHVVLQVHAGFGSAGAAGGVEPEGGVIRAGGSGGEFREMR